MILISLTPSLRGRLRRQSAGGRASTAGAQAEPWTPGGWGSDVDLLVIVEHLNGHRKIELITRIRDALDDLMVAKDIVVATRQEMMDYRPIVGHLIHTACQEGKTLYERDRRGN